MMVTTRDDAMLLAVQVYNTPPLEEAIVRQYENLDGAPDVLLENAVSARSSVDAEAMAQAFVGDRAGYTGNNNMPTAEGGHIVDSACTACKSSISQLTPHLSLWPCKQSLL